ncbi:hypothetical protein K493DRAFT_368928 [Basidiobolus meristosporus CBS 931.73]|uniref:Peptidase C51 domain-containing protein n=1 Tax=Basidiobolus meristosporus CBS 931.73 TaxID=1314790 RepID=A0A1Y1YIC2_9FUNG|nr:hypothetical protein K493DRAFT_368928 [Basidiobolus meristosporus CBS 931.73]|eukprot:ORX97791.1 hypothetical protein K493DRAFT_368928 [Basidiobolus meristosporus CBS 931.73]
MVKLTSTLTYLFAAATAFLATSTEALPTQVVPSNSAQLNQTEVSGTSSKLSNISVLASCSRQFRFNNGQCTDWADARYYELTCQHTQWWGDARTWPSSARNVNGWVVSSQPRVPSIIVIQPGYQGCGSTGHVAVVERINNDGSVYTSNWNYKFNGQGGTYTTSYGNFYTGNGVSFLWHQ